MYFSKIVLPPEEMSLLKRLARRSPQRIRPEDTDAAAALCSKWRLIQPENNGMYSANKDGRRYLVYCKAQRRDLWMRNLWIPIIVSLVTNLILAVMRWLSPQILR